MLRAMEALSPLRGREALTEVTSLVGERMASRIDFTTTQEQAWLVLAARAMSAGGELAYSVDGEAKKATAEPVVINPDAAAIARENREEVHAGWDRPKASDHCPVAMFRVGETMLGIQGHPEFPAAYVEALVRGRTELIGADKVNATKFDAPTDEAIITNWLAKFLRT